jgi:hypothetical protein
VSSRRASKLAAASSSCRSSSQQQQACCCCRRWQPKQQAGGTRATRRGRAALNGQWGLLGPCLSARARTLAGVGALAVLCPGGVCWCAAQPDFVWRGLVSGLVGQGWLGGRCRARGWLVRLETDGARATHRLDSDHTVLPSCDSLRRGGARGCVHWLLCACCILARVCNRSSRRHISAHTTCEHRMRMPDEERERSRVPRHQDMAQRWPGPTTRGAQGAPAVYTLVCQRSAGHVSTERLRGPLLSTLPAGSRPVPGRTSGCWPTHPVLRASA